MQAQDAQRTFRTVLVGISLMSAVGFMIWLQSRFDGADRKNAVGVVNDYRSKTGWSVPEAIEKKHPGKPTSWSVVTQSSCSQYERVDIFVESEDYQFVVDINGPSIHPGNAAGEAILHLIDEPRPVPASSASAAPSAGMTGAPATSATAAP
jgi:hypothetical protein